MVVSLRILVFSSDDLLYLFLLCLLIFLAFVLKSGQSNSGSNRSGILRSLLACQQRRLLEVVVSVSMLCFKSSDLNESAKAHLNDIIEEETSCCFFKYSGFLPRF